MGDLISREAAIKWFFRPYSNEEYYSNLDVARALNAIPAADAVPVGWISVEDRLPDAFCKVLVTWKANGERVIDTAFWSDSGYAVSHWIVAPMKITHWMPMPEPPKEG